MNFFRKIIIILLIMLLVIAIVRWIMVITINYKNSYYRSSKEIGELFRIDFVDDNALLQDVNINKEINCTKFKILYEVPKSKIEENDYYSFSPSFSGLSDEFFKEDLDYLMKFDIRKDEVAYLNFNYNEYIVEKFFGKEYRPFPILIYIINSKTDRDNIRIFISVIVPYRLNCNIINLK